VAQATEAESQSPLAAQDAALSQVRSALAPAGVEEET
jgi:hypothetical protein